MKVQKNGGGYPYDCIDESETNYFCSDGERCFLAPKSEYESVSEWQDVTGDCDLKYGADQSWPNETSVVHDGETVVYTSNRGEKLGYRISVVRGRDLSPAQLALIVEKKEPQ